MQFSMNSAIMEGTSYYFNCLGVLLPYEFTGPKDEFLACRRTAWLGVNLNNTPVYDVYGPDAAKALNKICVNRDFSLMKPGDSKHALICNDQGKMLADGVIMCKEEGVYRSYWLAPVLEYFITTSGLDVHGEYNPDEYFFQIDGPKSLEILEEATQTDLHDIKFAKNKKVKICGTDMVVHRLGMSGALAYEVHGAAEDAEIAYRRIRDVLEKFDGRLQGTRNYSIINHTPGGYPNQLQHYSYPLLTSGEGLARFAAQKCFVPPVVGSAAACPDIVTATPFDVGWSRCINWDHDFMGKEALMELKKTRPRTCVTLEWDPDDVADTFASQFRGKDVEPYDAIEKYTQLSDASTGFTIRGDLVLVDGETVGVATGKTYAYFENRMISLAFINKEYAEEGREVVVLWGNPGGPQKEIRAKVARFPYYNGEFRNETFDTEKIPHPDFEAMKATPVEGDYDVVVKSPMGPMPGSFHYKVENGKLTGTATSAGVTVDITDGALNKNEFTHSMVMNTPMGPMPLKVTGDVVYDRIAGTMGEGPMAMRFTGHRVK